MRQPRVAMRAALSTRISHFATLSHGRSAIATMSKLSLEKPDGRYLILYGFDAPEKLECLDGTDLGAGMLTNDASPEQTAAGLRAVVILDEDQAARRAGTIAG